jgi:hypothetical protein
MTSWLRSASQPDSLSPVRNRTGNPHIIWPYRGRNPLIVMTSIIRCPTHLGYPFALTVLIIPGKSEDFCRDTASQPDSLSPVRNRTGNPHIIWPYRGRNPLIYLELFGLSAIGND